MKLVLIGFKNCGKTVFGQFLAEKLSLPFIDIDHLIEKKHQQLTQESLPFYEIFHKYGEEKFRSYEKACISSIESDSEAVVSTGGGSLLDPNNVEALQKIGTFIYLKASKEALLSRMRGERLPEFIDSRDPIHSFDEAFETRKKIYEKIAEVQIDIDQKSNLEIFIALQEELFKEAIVG